MRDFKEDSGQVESHTLGVYRTSATVKGGRRFSFGALVVVGDRRGKIGFGYGKSPDVPSAIEKATKRAKRDMSTIPLEGTTLPHQATGKFSASSVRLIPASPGTGVVAGGTVRAILELAGVTDCLTKCYGSTTTMNVVKAVFDGLSHLRRPADVEALRGVPLGKTETIEKIERGSRFIARPGEGREAAVAAAPAE